MGSTPTSDKAEDLSQYGPGFCFTSIYAAWHVGITLLSPFVTSPVVIIVVYRRHTLYSGQCLKNSFSDLIQIWHVDVTAPRGVLYSLVTLNSH